MRDISLQPVLAPFGMNHLFWLSSRDTILALDDALSEYRAVLGHRANLAWEPVSLNELISFHRQLFLWRILMDRPQILMSLNEEQGEPPT